MTEKFELKPISRAAIPGALQKAERYRLLNESWAAESICRDILAIEPDNQQVIVMLLLALTDQLATGHGRVMHDVRDTLARLTDPYQRAYYTGIASERHGQELASRGDGQQHDGVQCLPRGDGVVREGGGDSSAGQ